MSKYCYGRYDTGEPAFSYFKKNKHMPERHPRTGKLRRLLWIVKCTVWDIQFEKKLEKMEKKMPFICTKENPWNNNIKGQVQHPNAIEIEEDYGKGGGVADGDYVRYECPHCKHKFWMELPN